MDVHQLQCAVYCNSLCSLADSLTKQLVTAAEEERAAALCLPLAVCTQEAAMWNRTHPEDDWGAGFVSLQEPVNGWLRLTSSGWDRPQRSIETRERARRSRLVSWLILGLLVGVAILSPLAIDDARSRWTLGGWVLGLVLSAVLNRRGYVTAAGVLLVALFSGGILAANLASPIGLTMG